MRAFAVTVLLVAVCAAPVAAGGPNLQSMACTVDAVKADDDKVVFTVSGRGQLELPDPDHKGAAKFVETKLERCVITIPRKDIPAVNVSGSWADYQARAKALAGKTAWIQVRGAITIDDRTRIAAVRCNSAVWGPARQKP